MISAVGSLLDAEIDELVRALVENTKFIIEIRKFYGDPDETFTLPLLEVLPALLQSRSKKSSFKQLKNAKQVLLKAQDGTILALTDSNFSQYEQFTKLCEAAIQHFASVWLSASLKPLLKQYFSSIAPKLQLDWPAIETPTIQLLLTPTERVQALKYSGRIS